MKAYQVLIFCSTIIFALKRLLSGSAVSNIKPTSTVYDIRPRIVVICSGLPRSLRWTLNSLEMHINSPLRQYFRVDVSVHSYVHTENYSNIRSREFNIKLDNDEWKALRPTFVELENVATVKLQQEELLHKLTTFGDAWKDRFRSLSNYLLALHSLERATSLVLASKREYDGALILRPDLYYLDPIDGTLLLNIVKQRKLRAIVTVPCWQSWSGVNDRFMYGDFEYITTIGQRIHAIAQYCSKQQTALQGEQFLKWFLETGVHDSQFKKSNRNLSVICTNQRAIRIRANGATKLETFAPDFNISGFTPNAP